MPPGLFHLCPGLHVAAKVAIFRVLRKIASLTIFRVSCDFLQFFVMLIVNEVQSELSIFQNFAKIVKNRKSDDFLRYLRFFVVLCHLNNH